MSPCQAWPPGVWHVVSLAPVVGSVSLGGVHTSPTGLGLRACAPVRCSVILLAQGLTVVPCDGRGCLYPLPGGVAMPLWVSGGATPGRGALALWLRLAGVWVHTARSPLGPGAAYIPRVAQRCNTVVRCPNYVLGPRWLLRIASGVPRGHFVDSWVGVHVP